MLILRAYNVNVKSMLIYCLHIKMQVASDGYLRSSARYPKLCMEVNSTAIDLCCQLNMKQTTLAQTVESLLRPRSVSLSFPMIQEADTGDRKYIVLLSFSCKILCPCNFIFVKCFYILLLVYFIIYLINGSFYAWTVLSSYLFAYCE